MSHAQKCPICNGTGKVPSDYGERFHLDSAKMVTCHGCGGRGWVTVHSYDEFSYFPKYPPKTKKPKKLGFNMISGLEVVG